SSVSASTMYDVNVHVGNHTFWVAAWVKNTMAMGLPAMKYTWSQPLAFRRAAAVLACRWAVDTSSWYTTMSLKCRPYLAILFTMIFSWLFQSPLAPLSGWMRQGVWAPES